MILDAAEQRLLDYGPSGLILDAEDATTLADDPIHKLMIDRDPIRRERLASQPTVSRMENAVGRAELL